MLRSYVAADRSQALLELTLGDLLREQARLHPDRVALIGAGPQSITARWTYAELLRDASLTARALLDVLEPGERLALWAPNVAHWQVVQLGAALAGLVLVPINPASRPRELAHILRDSGAAAMALVSESRGNPMARHLEEIRSTLPSLREVIDLDQGLPVARDPRRPLPAVAPRDPAMIQYTSGTTGAPKGALLTHHGMINSAHLFSRRLELEKAPVWINAQPLFHVAGCVCNGLGAMSVGASQVCLLQFEPGRMLELIESERGSFIATVPVMLKALLDHPSFASRDLRSMRGLICGGAPVPPDLIERAERQLGCTLSVAFGLSEASGFLTAGHIGDSLEDRATTIGRPLAHTEVKVVDPAGSSDPVPVGVVGELCARGVGVMLGYHASRAAALDAEGWLHTGDLGTMDERGYLAIVGRLGDVIIRGGENVYPREIELVLAMHPGVAEAVVVGKPDAHWGETVAAFVKSATAPPPSEAELVAFARLHVATAKVPTTWVFVDAFPLTTTGKVQKFVLRDELANGTKTTS